MSWLYRNLLRGTVLSQEYRDLAKGLLLLSHEFGSLVGTYPRTHTHISIHLKICGLIVVSFREYLLKFEAHFRVSCIDSMHSAALLVVIRSGPGQKTHS